MISILEKTDSPLFARTEVRAEMSFHGAIPSRKDIKKEMVSSLNSKEELVVIKRINSIRGMQKVIIEANVYNSEKDLKKIEPKYILQRGVPKKEEKKETKETTEAPTEEKEGEVKKDTKEEEKEQKPQEKKTEEKPETQKEPEKDTKEEKVGSK